jgi:hypothetical protein
MSQLEKPLIILLMTKFGKAGKSGLSNLPNRSIQFWQFLETPRARCCLWSVPSTASPLEQTVASTALTSMPLDHFTLDRFTQIMPLPLALEHAVDLDRFTDAPDRALCRCPRPRASLNSILPLPAGNPRGTCELW